jgi:hypothetical protein
LPRESSGSSWTRRRHRQSAFRHLCAVEVSQRFSASCTCTYYSIVGLAPVLLLKVFSEQVDRQLARPRSACNQRPRVGLLGPIFCLSCCGLAFAFGVGRSCVICRLLGLLPLGLGVAKDYEAGVFFRRHGFLCRLTARRVGIFGHRVHVGDCVLTVLSPWKGLECLLYAENDILGGRRFVCGRRRALSLARAQPPGSAVSNPPVLSVYRKRTNIACIAIVSCSWARFGGGTDRSSGRCRCGCPRHRRSVGVSAHLRRVTPPRARNNDHART